CERPPPEGKISYFCISIENIMTDIQLYTKLSGLPLNLKSEVSDFIDFLKNKSMKSDNSKKRKAGKAKGLINMMDNFDDPIDGFKEYM
ncbi:MAG: DUF2281 domain-containing protein, partial [Cyclobacteriaceae bacterium]|nr:DUF2281 domain-containing protein [Cyclobacteriaceae bacterium]